MIYEKKRVEVYIDKIELGVFYLKDNSSLEYPTPLIRFYRIDCDKKRQTTVYSQKLLKHELPWDDTRTTGVTSNNLSDRDLNELIEHHFENFEYDDLVSSTEEEFMEAFKAMIEASSIEVGLK